MDQRLDLWYFLWWFVNEDDIGLMGAIGVSLFRIENKSFNLGSLINFPSVASLVVRSPDFNEIPPFMFYDLCSYNNVETRITFRGCLRSEFLHFCISILAVWYSIMRTHFRIMNSLIFTLEAKTQNQVWRYFFAFLPFFYFIKIPISPSFFLPLLPSPPYYPLFLTCLPDTPREREREKEEKKLRLVEEGSFSSAEQFVCCWSRNWKRNERAFKFFLIWKLKNDKN